MKIVTYENPILRKKSRPVTDIKDPKVQKLIAEMKDFVIEKGGAGLSAVQVGRLLRIIVINIKNNKFALINPKITSLSKNETTMEEGCLSFPGFFGLVRRPKEASVKGLDENAQPLNIKAEGLLAKVLQHEIDHLNGILFVDKMKSSQK